MAFSRQETAVQSRSDAALVERKTAALPLTFALATLIFGIAGLSALLLFVIAGLAALCSLIGALVVPCAIACARIVRRRKGLS
jgi:hypothetical protein